MPFRSERAARRVLDSGAAAGVCPAHAVEKRHDGRGDQFVSVRERGQDGLVVMPAFNEARTIGRVVDAIRATHPELDVLVVDDGSRDDTAATARRHGAMVVSHPFNLGYGAGLQTGYKVADRQGYDLVVQMDADGQHDPAWIAPLLAPLRAGNADLVIGSRFIRATGYQMGPTKSVGRVFFRNVLLAAGGPRISDPTSGFQALSRAVFRFCCSDFFPSDFPDIDVLLLLARNGFRILEVPVEMAPSPPARTAMHAGLRAVYYVYKMLLSTFRSRLVPRHERSLSEAKGEGA